jgi:hypothetical protein
MFLADFHAAVVDLIDGNTDTPVWDHVPDDIAEVPCFVVGHPQARETTTRVVFRVSVDVFVIGRRQTAGEPQSEVMALTDWLWTLFNGTRAVKSRNLEWVLTVRQLLPRVLSIAGLDCPAYAVTIDSEAATC